MKAPAAEEKALAAKETGGREGPCGEGDSPCGGGAADEKEEGEESEEETGGKAAEENTLAEDRARSRSPRPRPSAQIRSLRQALVRMRDHVHQVSAREGAALTAEESAATRAEADAARKELEALQAALDAALATRLPRLPPGWTVAAPPSLPDETAADAPSRAWTELHAAARAGRWDDLRQLLYPFLFCDYYSYWHNYSYY